MTALNPKAVEAAARDAQLAFLNRAEGWDRFSSTASVAKETPSKASTDLRLNRLKAAEDDLTAALPHLLEPRSLDVNLDEELWRDLCEKSDRTSPQDHPEMALINQAELFDYFASVRAEATLAEREACAKVAEEDDLPVRPPDFDDPKLKDFLAVRRIVKATGATIAHAIRARKP